MRLCPLSLLITGCNEQELYGEAQLAHNSVDRCYCVDQSLYTHQIAVNLVNKFRPTFSSFIWIEK